MDLTTFDEIRAKLGLASLGRPALVGLAALLIMVAVIAGRSLIDTATATSIELEPERALDVSGERSSADAPDVDPSETLFVHVSGAVNKPGLVEVALGSRVADAIEAAGGVSKEAEVDSVNLARKVEDGEHVIVSAIGSDHELGVESSPAQQAAGAQASQERQVNINVASADELESLPGIGPATAQKIIADRQSNGTFASVEDIKRVSGIGEAKFKQIESLICV